MICRLIRTCALIGLTLGWQALPAAGPKITTYAPIKNFSLPSFNENGFRTMLIRGREAVMLNANEAKLDDMVLTLFSGDADARVETVFVSPSAHVLVEQRVIFGEESVRVVNDDFELLGTDWRYDDPKRIILISKQARVVFRTELKDIIK